VRRLNANEVTTMAVLDNARDVTRHIKHVRQIRQFTSDPIPQDILDELLEIARWTGSARNTQPWRFIVINDPVKLKAISDVRTPINWVAGAQVGIAIALNGYSLATEAYDEGRVTERILIGAKLLGLGGGAAWFGDEDQQAEAKRILGIPAEINTRSVIALGYPLTTKDPRPGAASGRKPLSEIVRYNQYD
jgi:nitroreductase